MRPLLLFDRAKQNDHHLHTIPPNQVPPSPPPTTTTTTTCSQLSDLVHIHHAEDLCLEAEAEIVVLDQTPVTDVKVLKMEMTSGQKEEQRKMFLLYIKKKKRKDLKT
ncbi:uncharacterized protein LOC127282234 isoform X7 [Leptopilina boulardi]|uniref:uncharacterized protein LOC127282234 isoform X7 n=1 Tax=Leptopilina boulardi TaxID=63433 RepID=UPI0021F6581E|nr:uncharacterized protein LOC127282234 isoform X7 [Leptopilina boulardi]